MVVYMDLTMHGQFVVMFFHVRIDNKFVLLLLYMVIPVMDKTRFQLE